MIGDHEGCLRVCLSQKDREGKGKKRARRGKEKGKGSKNSCRYII